MPTTHSSSNNTSADQLRPEISKKPAQGHSATADPTSLEMSVPDRRRFDRPSTRFIDGLRESCLVLKPERVKSNVKRFWLMHRRQGAEGVDKLIQQPLSSLMIILVLGITLMLPAGAYIALSQAFTLGKEVQPVPKLTVFFKPDITFDQAQEMASQWDTWPQVSSIQLIDKKQGLSEFSAAQKMDPKLLAELDHNPLPHVASLMLPQWSKDDAATLTQRLKQENGVAIDWVQQDLLWVERLEAILTLSERFFWLFSWALGVVVVLIVANTVRLAIESRRQEIVVAKLVGATNSFVRRPFLYLGTALGLLGGLSALILFRVSGVYLAEPFTRLIEVYRWELDVAQWHFELVLAILLAAGLLGWFGAFTAAHRHLLEVEPT